MSLPSCPLVTTLGDCLTKLHEAPCQVAPGVIMQSDHIQSFVWPRAYQILFTWYIQAPEPAHCTCPDAKLQIIPYAVTQAHCHLSVLQPSYFHPNQELCQINFFAHD